MVHGSLRSMEQIIDNNYTYCLGALPPGLELFYTDSLHLKSILDTFALIANVGKHLPSVRIDRTSDMTVFPTYRDLT